MIDDIIAIISDYITDHMNNEITSHINNQMISQIFVNIVQHILKESDVLSNERNDISLFENSVRTATEYTIFMSQQLQLLSSANYYCDLRKQYSPNFFLVNSFGKMIS